MYPRCKCPELVEYIKWGGGGEEEERGEREGGVNVKRGREAEIYQSYGEGHIFRHVEREIYREGDIQGGRYTGREI